MLAGYWVSGAITLVNAFFVCTILGSLEGGNLRCGF
jgi:hypothetical protein